MRDFTIWADPHRGQMFAQVMTKSAAKGGPATYEVLGAAGEPLGDGIRLPAVAPVEVPPRGGLPSLNEIVRVRIPRM
ncbi:hypothetical protein [Streptomyces sp. NPDC005336]|uniref:hypothetical protein n=1 Tax=Streptomyces sp. NPDC005336 TaxID=3157035 RepID=UPI0033AB2794